MSIIDDIVKIRHIAAKLYASDAVKSVSIGPDAEVELILSSRDTGAFDLHVGGVTKFMGLGVNMDPLRTTVCVELIEDSRSMRIREAYKKAGFETRMI